VNHSDPQAYAVDAAILPRSDLDENYRGLIAIQIETAPGPEDCPRVGLIADEWDAVVDHFRNHANLAGRSPAALAG
jgi:predicted dithiol-disulfide oxidoreductase (DUF899 family)